MGFWERGVGFDGICWGVKVWDMREKVVMDFGDLRGVGRREVIRGLEVGES